jgi:hypothetical protein
MALGMPVLTKPVTSLGARREICLSSAPVTRLPAAAAR